MVHAIFYMHQTSGVCARMCAPDHTHQMEKTVPSTVILEEPMLFLLTLK